METGGDVEDIDLLLYQLDELKRLFEMHAVGMDLVGRDAVFDDKAPAAPLADSVQHLNSEAGSVFEGTAVLVHALVVEAAGKLRDQVPVATVDHAHLEAGPLAAVGGGGILLNGLCNLRVVHLYGRQHLPTLQLRPPQLMGRHEGGSAVGRSTCLAGVRVLAVVVDLEGGEHSEAVAHLHEAGEGKDAVVAA